MTWKGKIGTTKRVERPFGLGRITYGLCEIGLGLLYAAVSRQAMFET